jgi:site-specific DNA-cytosine methylase
LDLSHFLTAGELFSGAGGLSIGLERAGFQVVLANEIEPDFAKSFALNHPHSKVICILNKLSAFKCVGVGNLTEFNVFFQPTTMVRFRI